MPKSSLSPGSDSQLMGSATGKVWRALDSDVCDLYAPGHQFHYRHQSTAVRSPSLVVRSVLLEQSWVLLTLDGGRELRWRHHDPERLCRMLELLRGKCVSYPDHHALRVGPYWFNCATEADSWQDCRVTAPSLRR